MKVAVEGCCHGELDTIYDTIELLEKKNNCKVDLLLICGDFQSVRNYSDMECMAVPPKHRKMNTFYKYYSGERVAPVLTVFIGGNHEASNYLQELPYGGWVAPKIYYLGYAGVVQFGGIRIAGISGIYKGKDFLKGHFEHPPYSEDTKRSAYHIRTFDVFRMKQIQQPIDMFLSHDWPLGIHKYGDVNALLRKKKFFAEEIEKNILGNPAAAELLRLLKPTYWFSAHLHVKFPALVQHSADSNSKVTKFLALDKCLPRRPFLQVLDIPHDSSKPMKLELDPEWLAILKLTNHMLSLSKSNHYPGSDPGQRSSFTPTQEEINAIKDDFGGELTIPDNFDQTVPAYSPTLSKNMNKLGPAKTEVNPQTTLLCSMLDLTDPNAVFLGKDSTFNLPEDADNDVVDGDDDKDDIDEDYESESSFVSLSGSERSFSDRSLSFISTGNDSIILEASESIENAGEISLNKDKDDDDEEELQEILKAQKSIGNESLSEKLKKCKDGNKSASASSTNSEDDDAEFAEIIAAQKKEKLNTSKSSSETENTGSKNSSLLDSSLDCKALDISDDDPELEEIVSAQRKEKLAFISGGDKKLMEVSMENDDIEYQEIIAAQKKGDSVVQDIQQDFESLKPVYQSSPMVSIDDRVEQSLAGKDPLKVAGLKRGEVSKTMQSPVTKKFRRRNQDMYSDSTGEEDSV